MHSGFIVLLYLDFVIGKACVSVQEEKKTASDSSLASCVRKLKMLCYGTWDSLNAPLISVFGVSVAQNEVGLRPLILVNMVSIMLED